MPTFGTNDNTFVAYAFEVDLEKFEQYKKNLPENLLCKISKNVQDISVEEFVDTFHWKELTAITIAHNGTAVYVCDENHNFGTKPPQSEMEELLQLPIEYDVDPDDLSRVPLLFSTDSLEKLNFDHSHSTLEKLYQYIGKDECPPNSYVFYDCHYPMDCGSSFKGFKDQRDHQNPFQQWLDENEKYHLVLAYSFLVDEEKYKKYKVETFDPENHYDRLTRILSAKGHENLNTSKVRLSSYSSDFMHVFEEDGLECFSSYKETYVFVKQRAIIGTSNVLNLPVENLLDMYKDGENQKILELYGQFGDFKYGLGPHVFVSPKNGSSYEHYLVEFKLSRSRQKLPTP